MFKQFLRNKYYMLKYAIMNIILLSIACLISFKYLSNWNDVPLYCFFVAGLILFVLPNFILIYLSGIYYTSLLFFSQISISSNSLYLLIPLGIYCGTFSAAIMHNSSHGSIYPKWTNRIWGEICGIIQVSGFLGWFLAHMLHHSSPDHPEKDPHPPGNLSFSQFANSMGAMMKKALTNKYFEMMGTTKLTKRIWTWVAILSPINRFLRVYLMLLIFGPIGFVFFYVPFKMANTLIYADFNYRTHRQKQDGSFEILNLNHNWWYKFLNLISCGSYFHFNHHRNPSLFNPKYVALKAKPSINKLEKVSANSQLNENI